MAGALTSVGDTIPGTAVGTTPGIHLIGAGDIPIGIAHTGITTGTTIGGGIARIGAEVRAGEGRLQDRGVRALRYGLTVMYGREWGITSPGYGREHLPVREQVPMWYVHQA